MKVAKKLLFFLLLALLVFPEFQAQLKVIKSMPLNGVFENAAPPELTLDSWNKKAYQDQCAKHFDDSLGLKSDFVRLYNQLDFSIFKVVHAGKIIYGKEDYMYPLDYLHAAAGKDFAGKAVIDRHISELKKVQELLWNQHKIFLLVVLCPDKPTFYPEYIPDRYLGHQKKMTNVKYTAQRCLEEGVNVIDFNPYFLSMKNKSRYPLIPKAGVHWSFYGAYFAADSMARYLKAKTGFPVPKIVLDSISTPGHPVGEDNDIGATLNLIWNIPCPNLGYPKFHAVNEPGQPKPSALFVGDSFYWNWYNSGMISTMFSNSDFWYYCQDVYPQSNQKQNSVSGIDVEDAIKNQNFIILIQVNGAYGNIGFGFTEIAISALDPNNSKLMKTERSIRSNPRLMEDIRKKAERNHIDIDEQIRLDAIWIINLNKKQSQYKN